MKSSQFYLCSPKSLILHPTSSIQTLCANKKKNLSTQTIGSTWKSGIILCFHSDLRNTSNRKFDVGCNCGNSKNITSTVTVDSDKPSTYFTISQEGSSQINIDCTFRFAKTNTNGKYLRNGEWKPKIWAINPEQQQTSL